MTSFHLRCKAYLSIRSGVFDAYSTTQSNSKEMILQLSMYDGVVISFPLTQMCVSSIIAVHGLGANPEHAWLRHRDEAKNIEADVRWLIDLLPETLRAEEPRILPRIFCFNYQSAWLGSRLSKNRLENVAERLLDELYHTRMKVSQARPNASSPYHSYSFIVVRTTWMLIDQLFSSVIHLVE